MSNKSYERLLAQRDELAEACRSVKIVRINHLDPHSYFAAMEQVCQEVNAALAQLESN